MVILSTLATVTGTVAAFTTVFLVAAIKIHERTMPKRLQNGTKGKKKRGLRGNFWEISKALARVVTIPQKCQKLVEKTREHVILVRVWDLS